MQELAKKYAMVIIVPIYEREQSGFLYNTAVVIDNDDCLVGKGYGQFIKRGKVEDKI